MPNKPKPRTLGAEPLEERLPVSGSIAGVLFGYGLTQKEPWVSTNEPGVSTNEPGVSTPGYEVAKSPAPQPALDIFELNPLDIQFDAMAVDLVHGEETLLDTISSASEDMFVLTPLTPGDALSDVANDPHRERGDEILLMAVANNETQFSPFSSPKLRNDNFPSGGLPGVVNDVPVVSQEPIIVSSAAMVTVIDAKTLPSDPMPKTRDLESGVTVSGFYVDGQSAPSTVYLFGNRTTTVEVYVGYVEYVYDYHPMCPASQDDVEVKVKCFNTITGEEVKAPIWTPDTPNPGTDTSFWTWKCSEEQTTQAADRKFTFTAFVTINNCTDCYGNPIGTMKGEFSVDVHIHYAEMQVQFAGEGEFTRRTTEGGPTIKNTVVVGQEVKAKLFTIPF